jgi:hypothetical protein
VSRFPPKCLPVRPRLSSAAARLDPKLRPGYANFAVEDPPLKLVLNAPGNGDPGTINHLGVEV